MSKVRLYELLVNNKLAENPDKAKRLIMAGTVFSGQMRLDKPGMQVSKDMPVYIKQKSNHYVSRGGLKLEKAIQFFSLNMQNKILIDIGSSTGGFTDCALQNGAVRSYAIDVGYNQLDWKLRSDSRVIVMERTNFRHVTKDMLTHGEPNIATIDVSFISLKLIFPVLKHLLTKENDVIALIKPQFEAERDQVGDGGIVRNKDIHLEVLHKTIQSAANEGYNLKNITYSPITGGQGNIEFLAHFQFIPDIQKEAVMADLKNTVAEAHEVLIQMPN